MMDDFIEYENFLPSVRKSLYGKSKLEKRPIQHFHKKYKKVKFSTEGSSSDEELKNRKIEKIKSRKATPFKKQFKKLPLLQNESSCSCSQRPQELKRTIHTQDKKKKPKKKQVVISFSSSSESFDEEVEDNQLTPSKSELESFQNTFSDSFKRMSCNNISESTTSRSEMKIFKTPFNNSIKRNSYNISDSSSEDDQIIENNFDLDKFFNSCEISDFNESITEVHSGIDYEFVSDYAKDVKIIGSKSINQSNELQQDVIEILTVEDSDEDIIEGVSKVSNGLEQDEQIKNEIVSVENSDEDITEEIISKVSNDQNITSVVDKIQEVMIISDNEHKEISSPILEESQQQQEEEYSSEYCNAEYHNIEDKKLVVLKENQSVSVHGLFTLKVLHGKLEVLGGILSSNSDPVNLYSPRGSALICLKNVTQCDNSQEQESDEYIEVSRLVPIHSDLEYANDIFVEANCAAFICTKLDDSRVLCVEKYISQRIFPRLETDNVPQVVFEPTENLNAVKESSVWDVILNSVNSGTKLMIAGGKGVGKSTLLRFSINRLLSRFDKVRVLDLDPGQSEFFVPGCFSIVTVTEPVFGPNFTHLKQTDRSLLSNINVGHDPGAYIKCIKSLTAYLQTLDADCPVLVNYMGFAQGIGLNIIASAIKYIRPTDMIQIYSKNNSKNFKVDLTPKAVEENCKLFSEDHKTSLKFTDLNYKLHKVAAMNDEKDGWTVEPWKSREMSVLAYFGQMMPNGTTSLTSHELPMYEIKLSAIKITDLKGEEVSPANANANMVALCSLAQEPNIFICLGYGIIRGIDLECNKVILITPEPASVLEDVCYLVIGSVSLPPSIYMTADNVTGPIPYVMEGELASLGQITKRSYLPANKK